MKNLFALIIVFGFIATAPVSEVNAKALKKIYQCDQDDAHCVGEELIEVIRKLRKRIKALEENPQPDPVCEALDHQTYHAFVKDKVTYGGTSSLRNRLLSILKKHKFSLEHTAEDHVIHFSSYFDTNRIGVLVLNMEADESEIVQNLIDKGYYKICDF